MACAGGDAVQGNVALFFLLPLGDHQRAQLLPGTESKDKEESKDRPRHGQGVPPRTGCWDRAVTFGPIKWLLLYVLGPATKVFCFVNNTDIFPYSQNTIHL